MKAGICLLPIESGGKSLGRKNSPNQTADQPALTEWRSPEFDKCLADDLPTCAAMHLNFFFFAGRGLKSSDFNSLNHIGLQPRGAGFSFRPAATRIRPAKSSNFRKKFPGLCSLALPAGLSFLATSLEKLRTFRKRFDGWSV
jgi:hypothetical protein